MVHRLVAGAVAVAVVVGRVVIVIIHRSVEVETGARRSRKIAGQDEWCRGINDIDGDGDGDDGGDDDDDDENKSKMY